MIRRLAASCVLLCIAACSCPAVADGLLPEPSLRLLGPYGEWLCGLPLFEGVPYEVYVWVTPDTAGISCVAYRAVMDTVMSPPYDITFQYSAPNPVASSVTGAPFDPPGTEICFPECQREVFWAHKLVFMPLSHSAHAYLNLVPHDNYGVMLALTCTPPGNRYTNPHYFVDDWTAGIGGLCPGTEETSWGAIKSMFKDGGR